jgi:hypothetical protein
LTVWVLLTVMLCSVYFLVLLFCPHHHHHPLSEKSNRGRKVMEKNNNIDFLFWENCQDKIFGSGWQLSHSLLSHPFLNKFQLNFSKIVL